MYRHVLYLYRSRHKDTRWVTSREIKNIFKMDTIFLFSGHKAVLSGDGFVFESFTVFFFNLKFSNVECGQ